MINSIDVNSLLQREHRQQFLQDPVHSMAEIGNPFSDLFNSETDEHITLSHQWNQPSGLRFLVSAGPDSIALKLKQDDETLHYLFTFSSQFLEFCGRRAEPDDFKRFYAQLSHIQSVISSQGAKVLEGDSEQTNVDSAQQLIVTFMAHLNQFCAALSMGITESKKTSPLVAKLCLTVKSVATALLKGRSERAYISNAKQHGKGGLYAYMITLLKLIFVEKGVTQHSKVKVMPKVQIATLNNNTMSQSAVEWFMDKFESHLEEVEGKNAQLYYASDK